MPGTDADSLHFVLYRSRCLSEAFQVTDIDILRSALRNNATANISGFLHREKGFYIQYFEGPRASVAKLMRALEHDARHSDLRVLGKGQTQGRRFGRWSMGYSNDKDTTFGISSTMPDPIQADIDQLTRFLVSVADRQNDSAPYRKRQAPETTAIIEHRFPPVRD